MSHCQPNMSMLAVARLAASSSVSTYPASRITGGITVPAHSCRRLGERGAGGIQLARLHKVNGIKNAHNALAGAREVSPPHQYPSNGHRTAGRLVPAPRRRNSALSPPPTCPVSDCSSICSGDEPPTPWIRNSNPSPTGSRASAKASFAALTFAPNPRPSPTPSTSCGNNWSSVESPVKEPESGPVATTPPPYTAKATTPAAMPIVLLPTRISSGPTLPLLTTPTPKTRRYP